MSETGRAEDLDSQYGKVTGLMDPTGLHKGPSRPFRSPRSSGASLRKAAHRSCPLAGRGLKRVWIDGGQTLQAFLAEGLVDTVTVTRLPILIGRGIPLFGDLPRDVHLEHLDTRFFDSGVVQSSYAVKK